MRKITMTVMLAMMLAMMLTVTETVAILAVLVTTLPSNVLEAAVVAGGAAMFVCHHPCRLLTHPCCLACAVSPDF